MSHDNDLSEPSDESEKKMVSRRSWMKTLGAAAATPLFTESASAEIVTSNSGEGGRFGNIVNVVQAGADPTGEEPINPILEELRADDTLLFFPEGRYKMNTTFRYTGFTNFGINGSNATIVPTSADEWIGEDERCFLLGVYYNPGQRIYVHGLDFDYSAPNTGVRAIEAYAIDRLFVKNIDINGEHDTLWDAGGTFNLTDPNGVGVVDGFRVPDGTAALVDEGGRIQYGRSGITVNRYHKGGIWIRNCVIKSCWDNGLYATDSDGFVSIQGGLYQNNNISNLRLGGVDSVIQGPRVVVDRVRFNDLNQRGIRIEQGARVLVNNANIDLTNPNGHAITVENAVTSATISNANINIGSSPVQNSQGIVVSGNTGRVRVVGGRINIDGPDHGGNAISINSTDQTTEPVIVENLQITGDRGGEPGGRETVRCDRDSCTFRNLTIRQPGPAYRQGLTLTGNNCKVVYSNIQTTHHPLINTGSGTRVLSSVLDSYDGYAAARLYPSSSDIEFVDNTLAHGVKDDGATNLRLVSNRFPST
ncbi:right-handed parallel beta-helix repeat-containing protein [Halegenticoccus tardaugens]|uniref:right-handed parallel beta-helix repeat-containing protein n=1 Tax=Halegenticoccus tardaugens TaxID=2071624 RepID=UPI00100BD002|nr:right-handed parallel beta-helix repeat-containing protein [Halegenticoccus tardaugens]